MSKKHDQRKQHIPRPPALMSPRKEPPKVAESPQKPADVTPKIVADRALDAAIEHTGELPAESDLPPPPLDQWPEVWRQVQQAQTGFQMAEAALNDARAKLAVDLERATQRKAEAEVTAKELEEAKKAWVAAEARERAALADRRTALEAETAAVAAVHAEVERQRATIDARESDIAAREAEAAAGFSTWRREQAALLTQEVEGLRRDSLAMTEKLAQARLTWAREEAALRDAAVREITELRASAIKESQAQAEKLLHEREKALDEKESKQRAAEARWKAERRSLDELKENLAARIEEETRAVHTSYQRRLAQEAQVREGLELELETLRQRVGAVDEWERSLGQDPVLARKQLRDLEAKIGKLQKQLANRPIEGTEDRLREAEASLAVLGAELDAARADNARLRAKLATVERDMSELDTARRDAQAYRVQRDLLKQRVDELDNMVRGAEQANAAKTPFKACSEIEAQHKTRTQVSEASVQLSRLVEHIRLGLAHDHKLYYTARTIRTLLAGMASSKLILLEGISGTGKTSLPTFLAKVVGWHAARVEVQAGWRDKQDLFGHYNTFERSYHETAFLKELVRAGTLAMQNLPAFIVLDEMNLSHPEQYFADVLSALEGGDRLPSVEVHGVELPNSPELLKGGRVILQPNTWFFGTANQDETTKAFADKTYDRAHIMQLPRHRPADAVAEGGPREGKQEPIGVERLQEAFDAAQHNAKEATHALDVLEKRLAPMLERQFDVGWGNRFERQTRAFVPVFRATGGTLGEAVDHLVATKLLRKIKGRHDIDAESIRALRDEVFRALEELDKAWTLGMKKSGEDGDVQSLLLLDREGRQSGGGSWKKWWETP